MNVFPINFNPNSDSGPNSFTKNLFVNLEKDFNVKIDFDISRSDIEFALIYSNIKRKKPRITRLDGIYFNLAQDYNALNEPILDTYNDSDCVVFQSQFDKSLVEKWFGDHNNGIVIANGADINRIAEIETASLEDMFGEREVWSCASSWRPHKRLNENIRYFLENADKDAVFIIAGTGVSKEDFLGYEKFVNNRIFYAGHLVWESLISLYKKSSTFVHLSYLDHCPNVVVEAAACNCDIVCSSTGGTQEISAKKLRIIQEDAWNFEPIHLYSPPKMDFSNFIEKECEDINTISQSTQKYFNAMENISEKS